MPEIENTQLVTNVDGCMRLTWLAENLTTGIASIFTMKMSIPDEGISYDLGTLNGRVPETQYNTKCTGKGAGLTRGNTTYNERTVSFTIGDDYNSLNAVDPTVCRQLVVAVLNGETFYVGSDIYKVIGTNGVRAVGSFLNDLDHKFLFLEEGRVYSPDLSNADGTTATETNNFVTAYKENNCIAMEFLYAFTSNKTKGDRIPYILASGSTFQEGSGSDYNKYSIEAMRYSDVVSTDKYLLQGLYLPQDMEIAGADEIKRVEADIIISVSGGGTPTVAGNLNDTAVVIDTEAGANAGTVEMYKFTTTWVDAPITSTLASGARIYSRSFDTALNGASAVAKAGYVAIKTSGTTGNAVAVSNKTGTSGSGTAGYTWDVYDWQFSTSSFQLSDGTN